MGKVAKDASESRSIIKKEQWEMPISFDEAGNLVSLREYVKEGHKMLAFSALSAASGETD